MKKFLPILLLLCSASALASQEESASAPAQAIEAPAIQPDAMSVLTGYAMSLLNTPYRYAGSSLEHGFDCSGFVRHVFLETLGWLLPHSSREISREGEPLQLDQLRPGDLVFFNTRRKPFSHVGIYIGDNQFIHSPSQGKSIEVVNMSERYWRRRYNGARRIPLQNS